MSTRVSLREEVREPEGAYLFSSSTKMMSLSTPSLPCSAISQTLFMTLVTTRSWGTPDRCEMSTTRISRSLKGPTTSGEPASVLEAVKAGASGYLVKTATRDELHDAVARTFVGEAVFPAGLAA